MALDIGELQVHYSGGAANESPAASLGGAISTATANKVLSQSATASTGITGVTLDDAYGNPEGVGVLMWDGDQKALFWKPYGAAQYSPGTTVTDTGATPTTYAVGDSSGYIVVTVVYSSLPATGQTTDNTTIADLLEKTFDDVSAQQSLDGRVEYRCFYIKNTNATTTAQSVTVWIDSQPSGPDELDISCDRTVTANETAMGPLADEIDSTNVLDPTPGTGNILPWARPSSQATGLALGNLAAGQYVYFWERRTVAAQTTQKDLSDKSRIGISAVSA